MKKLGDECDVLVAGTGLAGLTAAVTAAECGARTVVIEKSHALGGTTVLSEGFMAFAGTQEQAEGGIEDNPDLLHADLVAAGGGRSDPRLLAVYRERQLATYGWLKEQGVEFGVPQAAAGQTVPRSHPTDPTRLIETLAEKARSAGAVIFTEAQATRLIDSMGRVIGADIQVGGMRETLRASSVIICTGGFSRNRELLSRLAPGTDGSTLGGARTNEGDGLLMGWKLGAAVADLPFIRPTYGHCPSGVEEDDEQPTIILAMYKGGIIVDSDGKRFVDESRDYKTIAEACNSQRDSVSFQIFDASVLEQSEPDIPVYDFQRHVLAGRVAQASTVRGLGEKLGISPERLRQTVEQYNVGAHGASSPPFERHHLSGAYGTVFPLNTPPFFGIRTSTIVTTTYGGLLVEDTGQVSDVFGEVIPGLYAVGEVTGGFHGDGYMTGTSLGKASVFGRIAGAHSSGHSID